jgi:hypothetical protein
LDGQAENKPKQLTREHADGFGRHGTLQFGIFLRIAATLPNSNNLFLQGLRFMPTYGWRGIGLAMNTALLQI